MINAVVIPNFYWRKDSTFLLFFVASQTFFIFDMASRGHKRTVPQIFQGNSFAYKMTQ